MIQKLQKFLLSMLDPNGAVSFGRCMAFMSLVAILSWDSANLFFAWKFNYHLPPGLAPLPLLPDTSIMIGQAAFAGTFYGVTKAGDWKHVGTNGSSTEEVQMQK